MITFSKTKKLIIILFTLIIIGFLWYTIHNNYHLDPKVTKCEALGGIVVRNAEKDIKCVRLIPIDE